MHQGLIKIQVVKKAQLKSNGMLKIIGHICYLSLYLAYKCVCAKQCGQMAALFSNIFPFTTKKICPLTYSFVRVGSKFCQTLNKLSKIAKDGKYFYQNVKILPYLLVTLNCEGNFYAQNVEVSGDPNDA